MSEEERQTLLKIRDIAERNSSPDWTALSRLACDALWPSHAIEIPAPKKDPQVVSEEERPWASNVRVRLKGEWKTEALSKDYCHIKRGDRVLVVNYDEIERIEKDPQLVSEEEVIADLEDALRKVRTGMFAKSATAHLATCAERLLRSIGKPSPIPPQPSSLTGPLGEKALKRVAKLKAMIEQLRYESLDGDGCCGCGHEEGDGSCMECTALTELEYLRRDLGVTDTGESEKSEVPKIQVKVDSTMKDGEWRLEHKNPNNEAGDES